MKKTLSSLLAIALCLVSFASDAVPFPGNLGTPVVITITVRIHSTIRTLADAESLVIAGQNSVISESCRNLVGSVAETAAEPTFQVDGSNHYTCNLNAPHGYEGESGADRTVLFIPT